MIHTEVREGIKKAMLAKDSLRLSVLRGLLSAFTNELVSKRRRPDEELSDEEALEVIRRGVKQRKDSIEQFEKGGRTDLADAERSELPILESFLPAQMSEDQILTFVKNKISENGPIDASKKGQFMGMIMKDLKGKADSALVKEVIDALIV